MIFKLKGMIYALVERSHAFIGIIIGFALACFVYRWLRAKILQKNLEDALNRIKQYNAALEKIIYNYPVNKNMDPSLVAQFIVELKGKKDNESKILELVKNKKKEMKGSSPHGN